MDKKIQEIFDAISEELEDSSFDDNVEDGYIDGFSDGINTSLAIIKNLTEDDDNEEVIDNTFEVDTEKMANQDWISLLSRQFKVNNSTARDMLHAIMDIKREDTVSRQILKIRGGEKK